LQVFKGFGEVFKVSGGPGKVFVSEILHFVSTTPESEIF